MKCHGWWVASASMIVCLSVSPPPSARDGCPCNLLLYRFNHYAMKYRKSTCILKILQYWRFTWLKGKWDVIKVWIQQILFKFSHNDTIRCIALYLTIFTFFKNNTTKFFVTRKSTVKYNFDCDLRLHCFIVLLFGRISANKKSALWNHHVLNHRWWFTISIDSDRWQHCHHLDTHIPKVWGNNSLFISRIYDHYSSCALRTISFEWWWGLCTVSTASDTLLSWRSVPLRKICGSC